MPHCRGSGAVPRCRDESGAAARPAGTGRPGRDGEGPRSVAAAVRREHRRRRAGAGPDAVASRCTEGFRATYGFAPSDYQRDLRLRRARVLLAEGTAPPTAAAEVGFADQAHLTRWITRTYGVTPAAYRTAIHQDSHRSQSAARGPRR
ncbi:helix-turn-helix domain-containing protein [Streptomyces sp. A475]|uniref:helix-turn-helix domain-containing protein n=1 Tax=Streptomyces sp. A475 TaxID=3131976 RepID=UPI0030C98C39